MQNNLKATSRFMKRRSFMAKLGIATAAATLPASLSANDDDEQQPDHDDARDDARLAFSRLNAPKPGR